MDQTELKPAMVEQFFSDFFTNQRIGILGFGREGISSYKTIRRYVPESKILILDKSELSAEKKGIIDFDTNVEIFTGENYLKKLYETDLIIKSPGIPTMVLEDFGYNGLISSQADLFLKLFAGQVVGITGTKGKSTTASLLHHILVASGRKSLLGGNIGVPPFELIDEITENAIVVLELSSHQLENCTTSPHISVLLNLFQEHLDHYRSYFDYQLAKGNIFKFQNHSNYVIADFSNLEFESLLGYLNPVSQKIDLGNTGLIKNKGNFVNEDLIVEVNNFIFSVEGLAQQIRIPGKHNLKNVSAAAVAAFLCGLDSKSIASGVSSFRGLPHRLEYIGEVRGIQFYNDSISTIPQATIEALKAFPRASTVIVGGYDRGIDYEPLAEFLSSTQVKNIVLVGTAGKRIYAEIKKKNSLSYLRLLLPDNFADGFEMAIKHTEKGQACLLSPAASSYDEFENFEHRGNVFRNLVEGFAKKIALD